MDLDRFDRQLLNLVQEDSGQTAERLAEQVELSPSAIRRRLRRLRDEGVIIRDCAIVDPASVGQPEPFVVALQVERERADLLAQLRKWLGPSLHTTGVLCDRRGGFHSGRDVSDTEAYEALMSRMMSANANVRRFNTHVTLSMLKRGLAIPIPLNDASTSPGAE